MRLNPLTAAVRRGVMLQQSWAENDDSFDSDRMASAEQARIEAERERMALVLAGDAHCRKAA